MKKRGKDPISNSDWLIYLQSKNSHLIGIIFPFLTAYLVITIAVVQINLQLGEDQMPTSVGGISLFLLAMLFIVVFLVGSITLPYSRLQKRIIKGQLTNHIEILKAYEEIEKKDFHTTIIDEFKTLLHLKKKKK